MRDGIASGGKLQVVSARREAGCLEVENVSASRTQRRVKAEIATGIRVTRRGRRAGVTGPAGHLSHVQRYGGGGNVAAIYVAEIKLDREGRTAVDRSRLVVERADAIGNIFGEASAAAKEATVAAVSRNEGMRGDGKRRGCKCG